MNIEVFFQHTLFVIIIGSIIGSAWGAKELAKGKSKIGIVIEFLVGTVLGISSGMHTVTYGGLWLGFLGACVAGGIGATVLTAIKGLAPSIIKKFLEKKFNG